MSVSKPNSRPRQAPLVFISAAEPSADRHGAALIRAARAAQPDIRFIGVAGPAMVKEGCESIYDMTVHAAMLAGIFRVLGRGIKLLRLVTRTLREHPFDAAVLIDSPTLHLPMAARARKAGVPVLYYIAPQLWAWGASRIGRLRRRVDELAVILPFEERYFRERGLRATFVGHPLGDQLAGSAPDENEVRAIRERGKPVIGLLPGSRRHVVEEVLPGQLAVARRISSELPGASFCVSVANEQVVPVIKTETARCDVAVQTHIGDHRAVIQAADLVLVASGTTTLDVALHGCPMIVMYNASRWFYHLVGRWLIRTPHLSLPNILAGKEVVPEFMPYYTSVDPIAAKALDMLQSPVLLRETAAALSKLTAPLKTPGASRAAAKLLREMIDRKPRESQLDPRKSNGTSVET